MTKDESSMFADSKTKSVEWKSLPKKEKSEMTEHSTQTRKMVGVEMAVQVLVSDSKITQTDKEIVPQIASSGSKEANSAEMVEFLNRVESLMSSHLIANAKSIAFQGYFVEWEEEVKDITLSYTLSNDKILPLAKHITSISWNSTGSTIAASFACKDHDDWCSHHGQVAAWNMAMRNFRSEQPFFHAETPSCLMSIAFHPIIPSLIVGGTFTGEIIVWSTLETHDPIIATSKISDFSHHEPVAQLMWIKSDTLSQLDSYKIVSVGNDGKILEWSLENNKLALPILISNVHTKCIPRLLKLQADVAPLGIKCIAWTKDDVFEYIIGTETGYVLRCSSKRASQITKQTNNEQISQNNPVVFAYEPHIGACLSISFSPFHRNLFLTSGADGIVRLYHVHSFSPILTWEPALGYVVSVQWSTTRPSVFSCATEKGTALIFDFCASKISPVAEIKGSSEDQGLSDLKFNPARREVVAIGMDNSINVWKLKSSLYSSDGLLELNALNQFSLL